ncbi:response regulator [Micromonospora andamanensis]|uniref:DNA-binding response regulator n=1 Tax=Micromonospora andamanensis TaxID=1287068 RepID=A0ABQ4I243_9ACTN|nr:response regulator transcription factor [Micromonospora andamanensis]GIJ11972.1 DNA-binding response regulator [Micromonospora andamanensis]GIJ41133.1 DNA-binding response regulator [Micromonospora andamanensis]
MSIRVLIADDQEDLRNGYRMVIDAQPDMTVIGEASDGRAAVDLARRLRPDVVLADIRMPKMDGLDVTRILAGADADPKFRVVVVTTFDLDEYVHAALRNGACGFLLKRSGPTLLIEAIRAAVDGNTLISPQITVRLLRHLTRSVGTGSSTPLTDRETLVADLVAQGLTNADIAAELHLAAGTVKNVVAVISRKLDVRNRVGIALWVWDNRRPAR